MRISFGVSVASCIVVAVIGCGGGSSDGDQVGSPPRLTPTITINVWHSDVVFDATRQSFYAVDGSDSTVPTKVVSVALPSGQVQDLVVPSDPPSYSPINPMRGTLSLSARSQYLYFTTSGGAVSRVDLASRTVHLTVSAPVALNAKVAATAASRTDDTTAYVQLMSNANDPDSIGVMRNGQWGTQWVQVARPAFGTRALAMRSDDAELVSRASDLAMVRISAGGPELVLSSVPSSGSDVPQYVSIGILAPGRVYDANLGFLFDIPGASVCGVLPSRSRVVCAASAVSSGHELFVFDLLTRTRVASWLAGFDTGTIFVVTPALQITPIGAGRIAVGYGSANKLATYGPSVLAIYSDQAFN